MKRAWPLESFTPYASFSNSCIAFSIVVPVATLVSSFLEKTINNSILVKKFMLRSSTQLAVTNTVNKKSKKSYILATVEGFKMIASL